MPAQVLLPIIVTLFAGLAIGCRDSLGPKPVADTFALQRVAGDPLPTVLYDNGLIATRVISDTIRLQNDGTGTISGVRETAPLQPGITAEPPTHRTTDIHYQVDGGRIQITYDCPPGALCVPPPHLIADLTENGLQVRWGPRMDGRNPLLYTRVPVTP
jgi:hypothetical protein